jgi:hypothetical protein
MKLVILFVMLAAWFATCPAGAAEEADRSQVLAATKDAVSNLLDEVARVPLTARLSVGDFLRQTRSTEEMVRVLQRAQQMGGARWIDDHTCQVELQISGPIVAQQLKRAAADARRSPLSVAEVEYAVRNWDERAFSATGTATSRVPAAGVARGSGSGRNGETRIGVMPNHGVGFVGGGEGGLGAAERPIRDRWNDVNEAGRDQTIAAARGDAARRSLASVRAIPITRGVTVGDVLRVREVDDGMHDWFVARKPARVELSPDGEATVELSAAPVEAFDAFRGLAEKQKDVAVPTDAETWERVRREFDRQMATPIGRAVAPLGGGRAAAGVSPAHGKGGDIGEMPIGRRPTVLVPDRAPDWVSERRSANGRGTPDRSSKLRAARAAEAAAEENLRHDIERLPLTEKQTVGQAAKVDPRIERAIGRALNRARISRANYHDDGSADVDVYLDLEVLWQELRDVQ